jgi:hypothetical protein
MHDPFWPLAREGSGAIGRSSARHSGIQNITNQPNGIRPLRIREDGTLRLKGLEKAQRLRR